MNMVKALIPFMAIIYKWDAFCYGEKYELEVFDNKDPTLEISQNNVALWNLLSRIFQYEESVTVMTDTSGAQDPTWHNTFIHLLSTNLGLPLTVIESSKDLKRTSNFQKLSNHGINTNTSYILVMDDLNVYSSLLDRAKAGSITYNPRAKFVMISYGGSSLEIEIIMQRMWMDYGIAKVTAINIVTGYAAKYSVLKTGLKIFNITDKEQILEPARPGLEGYPIKVILTDNPPMSVAIPNSTRFDGLNQILIDTLEKHMNFTTVICKPTNSIEQVINREVDLVANMMYITSRNKTGYEFTTPFFTERVHVTVPKSRQVPIWLRMFQIFDNKVWIPTSILFALCVITWILISKFYVNPGYQWDVGLVTINVFFLLTGQPLSRRSNKFVERLFLICGSMFAVIIGSCFAGHLFQRYSDVIHYPDIDDLEELEKSGLPLVHGGHGVMSALRGTEDPVLNKLLKNIDEYNNISTAFDLKNGVLDHAVISHLTRIKYENANSLVKNNGTNLLHMMKESLGKFSMAYIVPKGWVFLSHFNSHINRILEAGLIQKWYNDGVYNYTLKMMKAKLISSEDLPRAFTISDLALAWWVLGIGLTISFMTFLIELCLK